MKYDELSTAVSKIRKGKNATGLCFVLQMNTRYPTTEAGFNPCGYRAALRARLPRPTYLGCAVAAERVVRVALHMRRGDIVSRGEQDRAAQLKLLGMRGVPNRCAADLLLQVLGPCSSSNYYYDCDYYCNHYSE